ncbi:MULTISPECIES: hypothetical protein [unclassified Shewanella]|nr:MULTISPECIES: hypothetical protein [unclassified Shewanella]
MQLLERRVAATDNGTQQTATERHFVTHDLHNGLCSYGERSVL